MIYHMTYHMTDWSLNTIIIAVAAVADSGRKTVKAEKETHTLKLIELLTTLSDMMDSTS